MSSLIDRKHYNYLTFNKQRFKGCLLVFLMFLWVFPPPLNISGSLFHLKNPVAGFLLAALLLFFLTRRKMSFDFIFFVAYLILTLLISVFFYVYHDVGDTYGVQTAAWGVVFFLSSFMLSFLYKVVYGEGFVRAIFLHLIIVGTTHAVFIYLLFISEHLRELTYGFIYAEGHAKTFVERNFRLHGIRTGGGADLSVIHAFVFSIILSYVFFFRKQITKYTLVILLLCSVVVFFSNTFIARTGFIISILSLFSIFIYSFWINSKLNLNILKATAVTSISFLLAFLVITSLLDRSIIEHFSSKVAPRAFALIVNFIEEGRIGSGSTDELMTMFFWPQEMLIGEGVFGRNRDIGYIASDVGYVRFSYGFGLFGTVLLYSFYMIVLCYSFYKHKIDPMLSLTVGTFSLYILFVNVKEVHSFATIGSAHIFFLLLSVLIHKKGARS